MHTSHLQRSSLDESRRSESYAKSKIWEKGLTMKQNELPAILKQLNPKSRQLQERGTFYEIASNFTTPLISFKRKLRR